MEHAICIQRDVLPPECIAACAGYDGIDGSLAESCRYWQRKLAFRVPRQQAIRALASTGAWYAHELALEDNGVLWQRVLWLAACTFDDGADVFVLA